MASNKELVEKIKETTPEFEQGELTNKELAAHLKSIAVPEPDAEAESFTVPKGKSILTLAGIKVGGDEITAKMVTGGADKLALLKEKGLLV